MKKANKKKVFLALLFLLCQSARAGQNNNTADSLFNSFATMRALAGYTLCFIGSIALFKHYTVITNGGYQALSIDNEITKRENSLHYSKEVTNHKKAIDLQEIARNRKKEIAIRLQIEQETNKEKKEKMKEEMEKKIEQETKQSKKRKEEIKCMNTIITDQEKALKEEIRQANSLAREFEKKECWKEMDSHIHETPLVGIACIMAAVFLMRQKN